MKVRDFGEIGIIEVDDIDEILSNDKFRQINDELKGKGYRKIALNLSQIDDDEFINIDYNDGSFSYQLPFTINLEETSRQITGKINSITDEKIVLDNITIFETGLIEGNNLKTKEIALDTFMEILQKLRRNI